MKRPLVSVVLCTYNGAKFLAAQIDSILSQAYAPIELIISDDASTDGTRAILEQYEQVPGVRVFYQDTNTGITSNFEFAAAQATGEWIAFADQDDIWLPGKIEKLVNAIGATPLVYSDSLLVNEAGHSMHHKLSTLRNMYSGNDSRGHILYSCVWGHTMLASKELLEKCRPMPASVHHDTWIVFQAFLRGGISYLDEVLTHYRQHDASLSGALPGRKMTEKTARRFLEYRKKLEWIRLMQQHERPGLQAFYRDLASRYAQKEKKLYVFSLLRFMLKHRKEIFMFSKKSQASQVVEILKQARGVRP